MKSIRYILLTYFQQHFFGTFGFVVALFLFLSANIYLFTQIGVNENTLEKSFDLFLYALLVMVYIVGMHLNRVIKSNSTALLPNYRRDQLITLFIILILFILWPTIILGICGIFILNPLALLLVGAIFVLWISFRFGEGIIVILFIIWGVRFFYEVLNFHTNVSYFENISLFVNSAFGNIFPVFIILLALAAFGLFFTYLKNVSIYKFLNGQQDNTDPWARDFDRTGPVTEKIMYRIIYKLVSKKSQNILAIIRKFQIYLFGPANIVNIQLINMVFILLYFFTISLVWGGGFAEISEDFIVVCFLFFFISISILSTDFLQHREKLPVLYLQSYFSERKQFLNIVVFSYLTVAVKQFIFLGIVFLFVPLFMPVLSFVNLWPMYILGFFAYIIVLSLSLIFSKEIISPEAKGWTLTNILFAIISTPIVLALREILTWQFFTVVGVLCLILFVFSIKIWEKTELDFSGPELPS
jgi:hypothetical protein